MTLARADAVVVFGASGDLARKKLWPALYRLRRAGALGLARPRGGIDLMGR